MDFVNVVAVGFSVTPFVIIIVLLLSLIIFRSMRVLWYGLLYTFLGVFAVLLKEIMVQKRPEGTCLISCGMPSGHSTASYGLVCFMFLEQITLYFAKSSTRNEVLWSVCCSLFLLPVPWSRVHLKDHSLAQVLVGSGVGIVFSVLFWLVLALNCMQKCSAWLTRKLRLKQGDVITLAFLKKAKTSKKKTEEDEHASPAPESPQSAVESKCRI